MEFSTGMFFACMLFSIVYALDDWGAKEGTSVWGTKELSSGQSALR